MAKKTPSFVCHACGALLLQWMGQCRECGSWDSIQECAPQVSGSAALSNELQWQALEDTQDQAPCARFATGLGEFDRVCGGGIPVGASILLGGDPGIGKSTLLLQAMASLAHQVPVAYWSGEESLGQIRMRAQRLGVASSPLLLASGNQLADLGRLLKAGSAPKVLVIDSIQTMKSSTADPLPGSVSQIRACTHELLELSKTHQMALILVSHVTKEGAIAGPKVLEHMVDTVLYFEGERGYPFRLLRGIKNRFGPVDEIGVFGMGETGLNEITNPSELFLKAHHTTSLPGSCVFAGIEGTRPLLVEVQALIAPSFLPSPRRSVVGWDPHRLAMLLAILEARCGVSFGQKDIFLNIVGGIKIHETAADLAAAAALLSCYHQRIIPRHCFFFGEVGLTGEIRSVSRGPSRVKEALKLGFDQGVLPLQENTLGGDLVLQSMQHISELRTWIQRLPQSLEK